MKKFEKILIFSSIAIAFLIAICFTLYFIRSLFWGTGIEVIFSTFVLLFTVGPGVVLLGFYFARREFLLKIRKVYLPLTCIWFVLQFAFIFSFTVLLCSVMTTSASLKTVENESEVEVKVVIVFGCYSADYPPSGHLRERLDRAYELLIEFPDAICVVAGGQGPDEFLPEGVVMSMYLIELGIDSDRIIVESASTSTSENFINALQLFEEHNIDIHSDNFVMYGVSHPYHLPRIAMIAGIEDTNFYSVACRNPNLISDFTPTIREYMAIWQWILLGK